MTAIKAIGLTKKYKSLTAVNRLNLEINEGELFALLGVNGAGKTTAVKLLSCLASASSGDAFLMGKSILTDTSDVKRLIALSPQETAVAPNLTVRENLELICGLHSFSRKKQTEKIDEITNALSLCEVLCRKAGKLSGGWQRRVSIAMALISEPRILFLDEPTLGLDVIARRELWDLILSLKGKMTVVLTTHYMEEAQALSDRVGIMKKGELIAVGTAAELQAKTGEDSFEKAFIAIVKGDEK